MARKRDRLFAGFGAVLFLVTACAASVFAIFSSNTTTPPDTTKQTTAQTCTSNQTETALAVPEAYKPDGKVTELQKTDLTTGTGVAAKSGDCLVVKYYGTLATTGAKFDENYTTTANFPFTLGKGMVIPGWDQGLVGMQAGGERRLVIPASLAYGAQSPSATIPANSDLVFVVKLLRIQKV